MEDLAPEVQERFDALLEQAEKQGFWNNAIDSNVKDNDKGLAVLFNYLYQNELMYVSDLDIWLYWNGVYWESKDYDDLQEFVEKLETLIKFRMNAVTFAKDDDKDGDPKAKENAKKNLLNCLENGLKRVTTTNGKRNVITAIRGCSAYRLRVKSEILDTDPYILCVKNGVVVLKDGRLREAQREDHCTFCAPVEWKGIDAPRPKWEKMLREIFGENNEETYEYFQRLMGMAIVGKVLEKNFLLMFGEEGDSGKTTIFEILFNVLGKYAAPMPVELLLDSGMPTNPNAPTPAIMNLRGKRICWASEPADNRRFSVDRIKLMSGGDTLTARSPYAREDVTFKPSHTLFMLSNNEPHASASDSAFWKRLRQIDCPFEFVDNPTKVNQKKVDRDLADDILREEAPGVLAWLVQGCKNYIDARGSNPPECILKATADYRNREDKVLQFKNECIVESPGHIIKGQEMYDKFKEWHEKSFGRAPSRTWFGKEAKRLFISQRSDGTKYLDVAFNDDGEYSDV